MPHAGSLEYPDFGSRAFALALAKLAATLREQAVSRDYPLARDPPQVDAVATRLDVALGSSVCYPLAMISMPLERSQLRQLRHPGH
jgi:hypothetical protein